MASQANSQFLSMDTLNPNIRAVDFGLAGPTYTRAYEIEKELEAGVKYPFPKLVMASLGDCHLGGQVPITFTRQVLALCAFPKLLESKDFPNDAKARAEKILKACRSGSIGSYTEPWGLTEIRKDVADYIAARDGHPSDFNDIVLCTGASVGVRQVMTMLLTGESGAKRAGFMIPIPQYPLYTASIAEFGAEAIPYYLDEKTNWSLDIAELERALAEAKPKCLPRAIVVVNPGNPSGSVLTKENIVEIVKFAHRNQLFLMADEVYQQNIWADGVQFVSFKKVLVEMGPPYNKMQLASFMSISKGYMGECGMRGGYSEVINLQPEVKAEYLKCVTTSLCPPVSGQAVLDCIVKPPEPGDPSYDNFIKEKSNILATLKEKAQMVTKLFNSVEGISCVEVMGSLYAFPRVHMPERAVEAARRAGLTPNNFYCLALLEETGVCTYPGCSFGEKPGTYHFRLTILPQMEDLGPALEKFKDFHLNFLAKYK